MAVGILSVGAQFGRRESGIAKCQVPGSMPRGGRWRISSVPVVPVWYISHRYSDRALPLKGESGSTPNFVVITKGLTLHKMY